MPGLEVAGFLDSDAFNATYPEAAARWESAASDLWAADSDEKPTDIGHKCRDAMQLFADVLCVRLGVAPQYSDLARDKTRVGAVAEALGTGLGEREAALLSAQAACWRAVSDVVQRQAHGNQKAETLIWEDARRVVFQTAVIMYEWHRVAARHRPGS